MRCLYWKSLRFLDVVDGCSRELGGHALYAFLTASTASVCLRHDQGHHFQVAVSVGYIGCMFTRGSAALLTVQPGRCRGLVWFVTRVGMCETIKPTHWQH